jgi:hypothetical protein
MRRIILLLAIASCSLPARAIDLHISNKALERTLLAQLFTGAGNRYYMRGDAKSPCYVYAENPKVNFKDDRIVVHITAHAKIGTSVAGRCVGVSLNTESDVSVVPEADGEVIGFRDARVEKLSDSRELNFLLTPFLSRQLPSAMKVNAADLMRQLLAKSTESTGYAITLNRLKIHSMLVEHIFPEPDLDVDIDGDLGVN